MQPTNEPASGPGTKLQPGCYLLAFKPSDPDAPIDYGSLRVEMVGDGFQASADLYHWEDGGPPVELVKPRAGVPVFPLANYRFYLRGEGRQLGPLETAGVQLNFGAFEYDARQKEVPLGAGPQFTALLHRNPAPPGYPEPHFFLSGPVVSRRGETVGTLTAGWVCSHLRKAEIELAATGRVPEPMANEAGLTWVEVFNVPEINWQLEVSQTRLAEPGPSPERVDGARPEQVEGPADPRGWTLAELHEAMMGVESEVPAADPPWRYTLLCVENILGDGFERGVMFDFGAFDLNETPREGAAIASGWTVPPDWGFGRDILFGTLKDAYLRTGIHEIGHALGLHHNFSDSGFMNTTDQLVEASKGLPSEQKFPKNIRWAFNPSDTVQLRHGPDIAIRPGGIPWRRSTQTMDEIMRLPPDRTEISADLQLVLLPPAGDLPLGAPVRLEYQLVNRSTRPLRAPDKLSLTSGNISGRVTGPEARPMQRHVRPMTHCTDRLSLAELAPGGSAWGAATLLRGPEGVLFPEPGRYTIELELEWWQNAQRIIAVGRAEVLVGGAANAEHANLANSLRAAPEVLLCLIAPGDRWAQGNALLERIVLGADSPLRNHYAYFQAKRWATPHCSRHPNYLQTFGALSRDTVLSRSELRNVLRWVRDSCSDWVDSDLAHRLVDDLRAWYQRLRSSDPAMLSQIEQLAGLMAPAGSGKPSPTQKAPARPGGKSEPLSRLALKQQTTPAQS